jgi:hypothetical protein
MAWPPRFVSGNLLPESAAGATGRLVAILDQSKWLRRQQAAAPSVETAQKRLVWEASYQSLLSSSCVATRQFLHLSV